NATTSSRGESDHQFRGRITCAAVGSRTSDTEGSVHLRLPHDGRRRPGARPRAGPAQSRPKIPGGTWRRLRVRRQAIPAGSVRRRIFSRDVKAITNFAAALPAPQSDLAHQTLKDPYIFDFLTMDAGARERDLELGLLNHVQKFLVELGVGFAFVGRQYPLEVSGEEFFLDLLFYHLRLRCFMVVDLKMEAFKPEFAGKMTFYLSAVV